MTYGRTATTYILGGFCTAVLLVGPRFARNYNIMHTYNGKLHVGHSCTRVTKGTFYESRVRDVVD